MSLYWKLHGGESCNGLDIPHGEKEPWHTQWCMAWWKGTMEEEGQKGHGWMTLPIEQGKVWWSAQGRPRIGWDGGEGWSIKVPQRPTGYGSDLTWYSSITIIKKRVLQMYIQYTIDMYVSFNYENDDSMFAKRHYNPCTFSKCDDLTTILSYSVHIGMNM